MDVDQGETESMERNSQGWTVQKSNEEAVNDDKVYLAHYSKNIDEQNMNFKTLIETQFLNKFPDLDKFTIITSAKI